MFFLFQTTNTCSLLVCAQWGAVPRDLQSPLFLLHDSFFECLSVWLSMRCVPHRVGDLLASSRSLIQLAWVPPLILATQVTNWKLCLSKVRVSLPVTILTVTNVSVGILEEVLAAKSSLWWRICDGRDNILRNVQTGLAPPTETTRLHRSPVHNHSTGGSKFHQFIDFIKVSYQNSNKMSWKHNLMPWFISRLSAESPRSDAGAWSRVAWTDQWPAPCEYQAGENLCFRATSSPRNRNIVCWQSRVITLPDTRNHSPHSACPSLSLRSPCLQSPPDLISNHLSLDTKITHYTDDNHLPYVSCNVSSAHFSFQYERGIYEAILML